MSMNRWNYKTHKYDSYEVPLNWICTTYSPNMSAIVNCPHCGKEFEFGEGYTSMEIHTESGFGYTVCPDCYEDEWIRRRYYEGRR